MKQTITSDGTKDLSVYDFNEEDELPDNQSQWSKFTNPNDKYHFLQQATAASNAQMKDGRSVEHVHVVAIDDDVDHGLINGVTHGSLGLLESVGTKLKEGFDIISGRSFQQHCHSMEDSIDTKSSSPSMEIKLSSHFRSPSGDGPNCSPIPESPSSDSSADAGTTDGCGNIEQSSPSPPVSPMDQNYVGRDLQEEDQPVSGLETVMENKEKGEGISVGNDESLEMSCFTDIVDDTAVYFQIIRLHKQIYAWIGCNSKIGSLYAAAPTRPNNTVSVTSILGGTSDNTGSGIARRLVLRTGLNIILACNLPKNNPMLEITVEKKLVEKLISLGYTKARSKDGPHL